MNSHKITSRAARNTTEATLESQYYVESKKYIFSKKIQSMQILEAWVLVILQFFIIFEHFGASKWLKILILTHKISYIQCL